MKISNSVNHHFLHFLRFSTSSKSFSCSVGYIVITVWYRLFIVFYVDSFLSIYVPKQILRLWFILLGIVLSWNMTKPGSQANIANYQIYAYQETNNVKPEALLWKKVGDVKALPLPMACTLTQFQKGNKYHFAVRAKDQHQRVGFFSEPQSIALTWFPVQ